MDWPRIGGTAAAVVVAVLVVSGQVSVWTAESGALAGDRPVHALLLAVATVPLFVRRQRPLLVLLLALGASWVQFELGGEAFQPWFAVLLALYAVGAHADRRSAVIGAVATAVAVLSGDIPRLLAGDRVEDVVPAWFVLAGIWGLGRWIRSRRRETADLAARAARAERDRAAHAAQAVADERARIARELHDLVAHSMGVIVIQSQAGRRAVDDEPDSARAALSAIESSGRQGLAEMRRLLGLLTSPEDGSVTPQPSLRGLDDLVSAVRSAGLPVELETVGELTGLPAGVDLAAYRIVQEALTNILKHAGPATARVHVRHARGLLEVEVCDDGRGARDPQPGRGQAGMRERVALYGGEIETGNLPGGGYRVRARLAVDGVPV
ncbi:sensor histidine kinase [Blastococcus sp. CT_GayMR19]|uniref:sensor histidine kinase n=1 Tax=Blastococcus sp. CT_GayMR19 TaxID=2559608 RepID=UPI001073F0EC|nr:histidine kinase [Blastococcus sp. CT_GayMR19]TFV78314.1 sensor histidine kinase [Blastococcus sp. CT_GayMR19]